MVSLKQLVCLKDTPNWTPFEETVLKSKTNKILSKLFCDSRGKNKINILLSFPQNRVSNIHFHTNRNSKSESQAQKNIKFHQPWKPFPSFCDFPDIPTQPLFPTTDQLTRLHFLPLSSWDNLESQADILQTTLRCLGEWHGLVYQSECYQFDCSSFFFSSTFQKIYSSMESPNIHPDGVRLSPQVSHFWQSLQCKTVSCFFWERENRN